MIVSAALQHAPRQADADGFAAMRDLMTATVAQPTQQPASKSAPRPKPKPKAKAGAGRTCEPPPPGDAAKASEETPMSRLQRATSWASSLLRDVGAGRQVLLKLSGLDCSKELGPQQP